MRQNGFDDGLRQFKVALRSDHRAVLVAFVLAVHQSIVSGSPITGAPGQPVDTGALRQSWMIDWLSDTLAEISTGLPYARSIEDGVSYAHGGTPMTLRSPTGGFHSVALTVGNAQALLDQAVRQSGGG